MVLTLLLIVLILSPAMYFWIDAMPRWFDLWWNNREPAKRRRAHRKIRDAYLKATYDASRER